MEVLIDDSVEGIDTTRKCTKIIYKKKKNKYKNTSKYGQNNKGNNGTVKDITTSEWTKEMFRPTFGWAAKQSAVAKKWKRYNKKENESTQLQKWK